MSAFMVSTDCMNRVVTTIMNRYWRAHSRVRTFGCVDLAADDAGEQLGAALYGLNRDALVQRYPDTHGGDGYSDVPEYRFEFSQAGEVARYKALRCLLYQCSEGDVPESVLYQELEALAHWQAAEIVAGLHSWDISDWG